MTNEQTQSIDIQDLIELFIRHEVLRFGEFTLKSGRLSPYFFNMGALDTGAALKQLAQGYAQRILSAQLAPQVLFGPAYKGIPIATATAFALADLGQDLGVAYNRKEAKAHGEGGQLVGAEVAGRRVLLVDDVLTAGTAIREAVDLVKAVGGEVVGVVIAMDRQEKVGLGAAHAETNLTAVAALAQELGGVPILSLLSLQDVMDYLEQAEASHNIDPEVGARMAQYQAQYCVF